MLITNFLLIVEYILVLNLALVLLIKIMAMKQAKNYQNLGHHSAAKINLQKFKVFQIGLKI